VSKSDGFRMSAATISVLPMTKPVVRTPKALTRDTDELLVCQV